MQSILERDGKILRAMREEKLAAACEKLLRKVADIVTDATTSLTPTASYKISNT